MQVIKTPEEALHQFWGYDQFRPLQREVIQSVLDKRDTLALMPTGGGKSICFQIPALCTEGVCLVVSPLIALMKDQVENLQKRGISATAIHSGLHYKDIDRLFDNAVDGGLKFLYVSPERLLTELAIERIKRMKIALIAVDEAHCVSQWGYDFRPAYLQIATLREHLPDVPILALTATATPDVVKDIIEKLEFKADNQTFTQDFNRSNLAYVVREVEDKEAKLYDIVSKVAGSGVVYARNRKRTKELSQFLNEHRISADFYHAGLSPDERSRKQDAWIEGKTRIMVATNAFGMGIDKPDVRSVVHIDLPDSLEAYFQEAGRGGRDGKKSFAVLLYHKSDAQTLALQFETAFPEMRDIRRAYEALGSFLQLAVGGGLGSSFDFDIAAFCHRFSFEVLKTYACFKVLEQDGWLAYTEGVSVPTRLKVKVSREQLYDYQLKNRNLEMVIKGILRAFPGVLNDYVAITEFALAQFLKMSVIDLEKILHHFHLENIIEYLPRKDKPQLTFLRERVDSQHLSIDYNLYMFRKRRAEFRYKKAVEYAELSICRSQQLLHYFGQHDAPACGICDVCLDKNKQELSPQEFDIFKEKIIRMLKREPLSIRDLAESFGERQRSQAIQTVSFLIEKGILMKEGDKLSLKN